MKKILHISSYFYPHIGGIESTCENIVRVFKGNKDYQQQVLCFGNEHVDMLDGVPITRVRSHLKIRSQSIALSYTRKLRKVIKAFNPDIILFHDPNPFATRSLLRCRYKGKLVVFHHMDIVKQKLIKKFVKPYLTLLYKKADIIISTSQNYLDHSEDLANYKDKCVVIPLCYREENVLLHKGEQDIVRTIRGSYKTPIAIFTGRHVGYKGLEYAIRAFQRVPETTFLVAGHGPLTKKLRKMAEGYNNIHFLGMLSNKSYRLYLNASDFFMFPSWQKNEAFGISLLEALAAGKPAITFTLPGSAVNWINQNGVTGIECKNSDVDDLAKAIKTMSIIDLKKMSSNAKRITEENFSIDKFQDKFVKLFNSIEINN